MINKSIVLKLISRQAQRRVRNARRKRKPDLIFINEAVDVQIFQKSRPIRRAEEEAFLSAIFEGEAFFGHKPKPGAVIPMTDEEFKRMFPMPPHMAAQMKMLDDLAGVGQTVMKFGEKGIEHIKRSELFKSVVIDDKPSALWKSDKK
jgi:hypothetical protein